jgi:hypothetical protein
MPISTRFNSRTAFDLGICLTILAGAGSYFAAAWLTMTPYAWNRGDIQQVLGFLTAARMPGQFEGDLVLDDPANYRAYWSLHSPAIELLTEFVGDPGTAALLLLPVQIAVYGCAWYLFGRTVFRSAFLGLLLTVLNVATVPIGLGTHWGIVQSPLPRQTFQALLPLLLLATWHFRHVPRAKPWLMVGAGLLLYTHAVSGPTIGFAIFGGLLWFWPSRWELTKRLWWALLSGVAFSATVLPFVIHYLASYQHGASNLDVHAVLRAMEFRYAAGFLEPWKAVMSFFRIWVSSGIMPATCIAAVWLWKKGTERETLVLFMTWLGCVLLFSILVPLVDHGIASARGAIPAELDVIRTVRYTIPFSMLIIVLALGVAFRDTPNQLARVCVGLVAVVATAVHLTANPPQRLWTVIKYVAGTYPTAEFRNYNRDWLDLLETVRTQTAPTARIAASGAERPQYIAVRYLAHRSLVYTFKDGGILGYCNHDRFLQWFDRSMDFRELRGIENSTERVQALASLVRDWGATHLILAGADRLEPQSLPAHTRLTYENASFQLMVLDPPPSLPRQSG